MKNIFLTFTILFFSLITASFFVGTPFIYSDGYGYYHVAKNLVEEGTFVSNIKPEYYYYSAHTTNIFDDRYVTVYSSANSIFWWPFLTIAKAFDGGTIYTDYFKAFNGHSLADGIAIKVAACFYAATLIILLYKLLRELKFSQKISAAGTIVALLSTYIFGYILFNGAYSHLYEVLSLTILLFAINRFRLFRKYKYLILAGIFAGFLVLARPANIVILVPIFSYLLTFKNIKSIGSFIIGGFPVAILYFLYNLDSFNLLIANSYKILWAEDFDFSKFNLGLLLFSEVRGWLVYSPVIIFAIIGLIIYCRKNLKESLIYLAPIAVLVLLYSFWPSWWAGDSLGQRFFLVLLPIIAIGTAIFLRRINYLNNYFKIFFVFAIIIFTGFSTTILILTRITDTRILNENNSYTAEAYPEVNPAERYTPFDLINYNLRLIREGKFPQPDSRYKSMFSLYFKGTEPAVKIENIDEDNFNLNILTAGGGHDEPVNINVYINRNGKEFSTNLKNVLTSKNSVIEFTCSELTCESDYQKAKNIEGVNYANKRFIEINNNTSVALESSENVIFVDYRLEDYKVWFVKRLH